MRYTITLYLFVVLVLLGCGGAGAAVVRVTETAVPATATSEPTPTATSEPLPTATPTVVPTPTVQPIELEISGFLFRPKRLEVAVGSTITWINLDNIQHTITSGVPDAPDGRFDSGFFVQNESFSHTFTEPGEYPYYCRRHPHMQAVIVVTEP